MCVLHDRTDGRTMVVLFKNLEAAIPGWMKQQLRCICWSEGECYCYCVQVEKMGDGMSRRLSSLLLEFVFLASAQVSAIRI